jgi:excisionase family DNA binding protein
VNQSCERSTIGLSDIEQPEETEPIADPRGTGPLKPLLLRAGEVARLLGLGRSTVFALLAAGELPVVRIGRSVRVPRVALERWIDERTDQATNRGDVQGPLVRDLGDGRPAD